MCMPSLWCMFLPFNNRTYAMSDKILQNGWRAVPVSVKEKFIEAQDPVEIKDIFPLSSLSLFSNVMAHYVRLFYCGMAVGKSAFITGRVIYTDLVIGCPILEP